VVFGYESTMRSRQNRLAHPTAATSIAVVGWYGSVPTPDDRDHAIGTRSSGFLFAGDPPQKREDVEVARD
jgi:hypothetical protein